MNKKEVLFGTNEYGAIEWDVLDVADGKALILARESQFNMKYYTKYGPITWENSCIRQMLVEWFVESNIDKRNVVEVLNENADNPKWGTHGGNDTNDMIFLLSIDEFEKYKHKIKYNHHWAWWWLRSPG